MEKIIEIKKISQRLNDWTRMEDMSFQVPKGDYRIETSFMKNKKTGSQDLVMKLIKILED